MGPEVHYHINNSSPSVPSLSHSNPVHTLQSYFWRICGQGYVVHLGLSSGLFPSSLHTKTAYAFVFCLICATCLTNLIFLYLIAHIIFYGEYQWCSFSLCNLLQSPVIFSLLDPYIFLSTLFLTTLSLQSSLNVERLCLTPKYINMQNYNSAHFNLYIFW
jgi:hypothetical protein